MRKFIQIIFAGLLALSLAACSENKIAADLKALNEIGKAAVGNNLSNDTLKQVAGAKTNEEKAALLKKAAGQLKQASDELAKFQPKTPEVKAIHDKLTSAMSGSVAAAQSASVAFEKQDSTALSASVSELQTNQRKLLEAAREMGALAKEKGVKLNS